MKKLLALLMCLLLMPVLPALAADELPLFRLAVTDENGQETTIGSALLYLDESMLLTSVPMDDPETVTAYGPDGTAYEVFTSVDGLYNVRMLLFNEPLKGTSTFISLEDRTACLLAGLTLDGRVYLEPAIGLTMAQFDGVEVYLVSAKEPLMPGAVLVDGNYDLIGTTVATWGEGENRYAMLSDLELANALLAYEADYMTQWLTDVELSYDAGMLTVDWSGAEIDGLSDDSAFMVFIQDVNNPYYLYYFVDEGELSKDVYVVPGRSYELWVSHYHGKDNATYYPPDETDITFTVPEAEAFTDYGFTDESYLAWGPKDGTPDVTDVMPPLETLTVEALADESRRLYLQTTNTYDVDAEIEASTLIMLHTPDGAMYVSAGSFIFSPEYEENDVWNVDVTDLRTMCLEYSDDGIVPGKYELLYTLDGQWAGGCTFVIE